MHSQQYTAFSAYYDSVASSAVETVWGQLTIPILFVKERRGWLPSRSIQPFYYTTHTYSAHIPTIFRPNRSVYLWRRVRSQEITLHAHSPLGVALPRIPPTRPPRSNVQSDYSTAISTTKYRTCEAYLSRTKKPSDLTISFLAATGAY